MVKAEEIDRVAFDETLEQITVTPSIRAESKRTLHTLNEKDASIDPEGESNIKIISALKQLGVQRINLSAFKTWHEKIVHSEIVTHDIWIQTKSAMPNLDKVIEKDWFYQSSEIRGNINKDAYWFVDINVPEPSRLGKGAKKWKIALAIVRTKDAIKEQHDPDVETRQVQDQLQGATHFQPLANPACRYKPRLLSAQLSDAESSDVKATEDLAQSTEKAFADEVYYLNDPMASKSAEFKLRMYIAHLRAKRKEAESAGAGAAAASMPVSNWSGGLLEPHMKVYLRYVVKWILEGDTFAVSQHFVKHLKDAQDIAPELVPRVASVIQFISGYRLDVVDAPDANTLLEMGLTPQQINVVFDSRFYRGFEKARLAALYQKVKGGALLKDEDRLAIVKMILESSQCEEQKITLTKVQTILQSPNEEVRLKFLLETPGAFDTLEEWWPNSPDLVYKIFAPDTKYKDKSARVFYKALIAFLKHREILQDSIANPIVKSLLHDFVRLNEAAEGVENSNRFAMALLEDLAGYKLGLAMDVQSRPFLIEGLNEMTLGRFSKVVLAAMKKDSIQKAVLSRQCHGLDVLWASLEQGALLGKPKPTESDATKEINPVSPSCVEEGRAKDQDKEDVEMPESGSFEVGDEVLLKVCKDKKFRNATGKVQQVKSTGLTVLISSGSEKGSIVTRPKTNFVKCSGGNKRLKVAGEAASTSNEKHCAAAEQKSSEEVSSGQTEAEVAMAAFGQPLPEW